MVHMVIPMSSVRRRPSTSLMKIVIIDETMHPKFHTPTVRPDLVSLLLLCVVLYIRKRSR
jgi:hypothetical protein